MTFRLPKLLQDPDDQPVIAALHKYYNPRSWGAGLFTGSLFDTWDSTGTRADDVDRFTADDLYAVTLLSVRVPPAAGHALLIDHNERFSSLLRHLGPDRDPDPVRLRQRLGPVR